MEESFEGGKGVGNPFLFTDSSHKIWRKDDVLAQLKRIGADNCEILFVHTDLMFGLPNPHMKKKEYLQSLYETLLDLHVPTLIFPAFTYSFPNHEVFDVCSSRTSMGALIEYIRKQPEVFRSLDPLLSMIAVGEQTNLLAGKPVSHCFGPDSGFDRLHQSNGVKFLFLGADFSEYFTYIHYIEKVLDVPYRFDMEFSGMILDYDGQTYEHTQAIHTQCGGVKLKNFWQLKQELLDSGYLKAVPLGNGEVSCISEKDIYREVTQRIQDDPYSFVEPYTEKDLTHIYTFGQNGERVTHC